MQLQATVYDSKVPAQVASANVMIVITRNAHAPVFSQSSYQVQVSDSTMLGQTVLVVNATDADPGVGASNF